MLDSSIILDIPIIDITEYRRCNPEKDIGKLECGWPMDKMHDEVVAVASLFDGTFEIPVCDRHLGWHRGILTLHEAGLKLEIILKLTREQLMRALAKRGLIPIRQ